MAEHATTGGTAVVGYVILLLLGAEAEVVNLAVAQLEQGAGIGRQLLTAGVETARRAGAKVIYLDVRQSNGAANHLYLTEGFSAVGLRRGYYEKPKEDAVVLRREFDTT